MRRAPRKHPAYRPLIKRIVSYFELKSQAEALLALVFGLFLLALRLFEIGRYQINSDEPQHLHLAWSWTQHLLPYRDTFDNHMPLFQLLSAPLVRLFGEHAFTLIAMRAAMLPIYFLVAWGTYRLGTLAVSRRTGVWAALFLSALPNYFFCSLQYRTDNLWTTCWLLCLLVLASGPLHKRRALLGGLLLGLCFAVSMKSILFVLALAYGSLVTTVVFQDKMRVRSLVPTVVCFIGAAAAIPALIGAAFALAGAWPQFSYDVLAHNLLPSREPAAARLIRLSLDLLGLGAVLLVAHNFRPLALKQRWHPLIVWIALIWGSYLFALLSVWQMLTAQDYLPSYPLAAILGAVIALQLYPWLRQLSGRLRIPPAFSPAAPVVVCLAGTSALLLLGHLGRNATHPDLAVIRDALRLTRTDEYVIDTKGETIFRRRAPSLVYESVTNDRLRKGLLADDLAERAVALHACFAATIGFDRLPPEALAFIAHNYLRIDHHACVAGCRIPSIGQPEHAGFFETKIPAEYGIVAIDPPLSGELDGKPYAGPVFLAPGWHRFIAAQPHQSLAAIWSRAINAHLDPFRFLRHPAKR